MVTRLISSSRRNDTEVPEGMLAVVNIPKTARLLSPIIVPNQISKRAICSSIVVCGTHNDSGLES